MKYQYTIPAPTPSHFKICQWLFMIKNNSSYCVKIRFYQQYKLFSAQLLQKCTETTLVGIVCFIQSHSPEKVTIAYQMLVIVLTLFCIRSEVT